MRNKIYALIITVTLFLSMNGITKAAEKENLKVGTIQFSQLKQIPLFLVVLIVSSKKPWHPFLFMYFLSIVTDVAVLL